MRVAVLDLGTNTFNLIIAEEQNKQIRLLYSSKLPVKLGEGGINRGIIGPAAFERGIEAVSRHYSVINEYGVQTIKALGTSALRTARNGKDFLDEIYTRTGIMVEIIDGDREAELIYYGVRETLPGQQGKFLILDIGGGSNELIIANHHTIFWSKSYPLGVARLLERFNPSDPITAGEIRKIYAYLETHTKDLIREVNNHQTNILIGASGSFETFASMIRGDDIHKETESSTSPETFHIPLRDFEDLHRRLVISTLAERKTMRGLEPMRIEMIVLASLFVKFILDKLDIHSIYQTNYALKEGVIYQLLKQNTNGTHSRNR